MPVLCFITIETLFNISRR